MTHDNFQRLHREYFENRILSAHPVEVVAMLFQAALENLADAIRHLKSGDRLARARSVTRAEQAIQELLIALDHSVDPAFSRRSADLYRFAIGRIAAGHAEQSERAFTEAITVLRPLAEAWTELKTRTCDEPARPDSTAEASKTPEPSVSDAYAGYRSGAAMAGSRDWSL
ncbi:MAG TPA: flagellar protein FliS [Bryobacteraceae bacterium]|nr:flagellar protein FliS [Bryobacteraceae bacterium]